MKRMLLTIPLLIVLCGCSGWRALTTERKLAVVQDRVKAVALLVDRLEQNGELAGTDLDAAKCTVEDAAKAYNVALALYEAGGDPDMAGQKADVVAAQLAALVAAYEKYVLEDGR